MENTTSLKTGSCLCGSVSYQARFNQSVSACHCSICRKWCSGPMLAVHATGDVELHGTEAISNYSSSDWAERGFCKHCGTNLYYHLLPQENTGESQWIFSAGTLDEQTGCSFDSEIFIDQAADWYEFAGAENRQRLSAEQVFAKFMSDTKTP